MRSRNDSILSILFALTVFVCSASQAQTFTVVHNFTGGGDGANPYAGVTMDPEGNLYGTTLAGGYTGFGCDLYPGCGTVYKLSHLPSGWTLSPIFTFHGTDGANSRARVIFGPQGLLLYGTTSAGGQGSGTVFRLTPPPMAVCRSVLCPWTEAILYTFQGTPDAASPGYGDVVFDAAGNLYGTTVNGGGDDDLCNDSTCGTVYELARSGSGWGESLLYEFGQGNIPGYWPYPGVIFDNAGNLYGAATWNYGTVFELTPGTGGSWTPNPLYVFSNYSRDGAGTAGGLIFDSAGNLYGTTSGDGPNNGGTVFELVRSGGQSTLNTLYAFTYSGMPGLNPPGPTSTLVMSGGNLYGTTLLDGAHNQGSVFKLSHSAGGWTLTTLHDFTGGADGGQPFGQLTIDASGNIYGTTTTGGSSVGRCNEGLGCGVVFEITP
jgi:uncharacterized repeat protein (TIGR03803 family)